MKPVPRLESPMTPHDALRRIAFLLERDRQSTYRVEAFRRAAAVVADLGANEITDRTRRRTLTQVSGIGKSSAAVITQALAGETPDYLASLDEVTGPLTEGGDELYAALRGDLHAHSDWSDGGVPVEEMATTAAELGQEWLAMTDHSPRLRVANGLSAERLARQIDLIECVNDADDGRFRLLSGIEVDILDDGGLDQTDEMLERVDVVTASVHSDLKMDRGPMTRRMVAAVRHPRVRVLGHCTGRLVTGGRGTRAPSTFDAEAVFTACAESNTAVEINSRPERVDPPDEMITLAIELGCLFAIDSDAHAPGQLDFKALGCERAERLGVPADRIVTTWGLERLRAWLNT